MVGILLSYWGGLFSGATLVSGRVYIGCSPFPLTVTTRIITFVVGDSYKPSSATVTGRGPHPSYTEQITGLFFLGEISKEQLLEVSSEKFLRMVKGFPMAKEP